MAKNESKSTRFCSEITSVQAGYDKKTGHCMVITRKAGRYYITPLLLNKTKQHFANDFRRDDLRLLRRVIGRRDLDKVAANDVDAGTSDGMNRIDQFLRRDAACFRRSCARRSRRIEHIDIDRQVDRTSRKLWQYSSSAAPALRTDGS